MNKRQSKKNHRNNIDHMMMLELRQELRIFSYKSIGLKQSEVERILKFFR